jgi:hypothetical protein
MQRAELACLRENEVAQTAMGQNYVGAFPTDAEPAPMRRNHIGRDAGLWRSDAVRDPARCPGVEL